MNYSALLKRLAAHVEAFKTMAARPPVERRTAKAVWAEWARDFEVALSLFAAHDGCTCNEIMAADPTRHFRGCVLREKYPDHPAAHETEKSNMPGPIVMEFLAWLRAQESPDTNLWSDADETICAEFFAQRIEAKQGDPRMNPVAAPFLRDAPWVVPESKRCGINGCTLPPGHPGDHGSYLMRDGRDMGPAFRPAAYEVKSNAWSSAAAAPPGAVEHKFDPPLDMTGRCGAQYTSGGSPSRCTRGEGHGGPHWYEPMAGQDEGLRELVKEWGKNYATRIDALEKTVKILDERTAYQSKCDANNADALKILHDALQQLEKRADICDEDAGVLIALKSKVQDLEDTLSEDFDTLRKRGDVHDDRLKLLEKLEPLLHDWNVFKRIEALEAQHRDITLASEIVDLDARIEKLEKKLDPRERSKFSWRDWGKEEVERELAPWPKPTGKMQDLPEELTNKALLKSACELLDGVLYDASGTLGPGSVAPERPTQEAEMLADKFISVRNRAFAHANEWSPYSADTSQHTRVLFKSWDIEKQRAYLQGLVEEHAYSYGRADRDVFPPIEQGIQQRISAAWADGKKHYEEEKKKP